VAARDCLDVWIDASLPGRVSNGPVSQDESGPGPGADQSTPVRQVRQSAMTRRMLRPARAGPRGLILTHGAAITWPAFALLRGAARAAKQARFRMALSALVSEALLVFGACFSYPALRRPLSPTSLRGQDVSFTRGFAPSSSSISTSSKTLGSGTWSSAACCIPTYGVSLLLRHSCCPLLRQTRCLWPRSTGLPHLVSTRPR
jgi:hypothetical protein